MKNFFTVFIGPIIVGLIVGIILFYSQQEEIEINYFLSEKIPLPSNESENSIQVVEIRNIGSKKADEINIKVNKQVVDYKIIKNSISDNEKVFNEAGKFEVDYDSLPVEGLFKLSIVTKGNGISKNDIEVSHSEGKAINALDEKNFFSIPVILFYCLLSFYVFNNLRVFFIERLERKARGYYNEELLKMSKPFYIDKIRWQYIREIAVSKFFRSTTTSINLFSFLNSDKPSYLADDEWTALVEEAISRFSEELEVKSFYDTTKILAILKKERPKNFPSEKWEQIRKHNEDIFIYSYKEKLSFLGLRELKALPMSKPDEITQTEWNKIIDYYNGKSYWEIINKLYFEDNPWSFLSKEDITNFSTTQQIDLQKLAINMEIAKLGNLFEYDKAIEFKENELDMTESYSYNKTYKPLVKIAEQTIAIESKKEELNLLIKIFKEMVWEGKLPSEKPDLVDNYLWEKILRIFKDVQYIFENKEELRNIETNLKPLIQKVERQLDLINTALNDKNALSRVEEYNSTFEKGNFENLRIIIEMHHQIKS